jgi:outer membrane receptor protein involved in Fe transport
MISRILLTLGFTIVYIFSLSAQISITGVVKDENAKALPYCSIALLSAKDSSLIKGGLSDENGSYKIESITQGTYIILASYVGYKDIYSDNFEIKPESKKAEVDLNFSNANLQLQEVVITAKKPFLEQKADRLVVNVANSAIAAGGTAMEILQKVPGLVIIQDKVTLGGSQNLQIWIDGKPSAYTDMNAVLRDMPGDQIDKIEVISQPGAQFDAAGGPVLNIVLKRNADLGFKTTIGMTVGGFKVNHEDVNKPSQFYSRLNPNISTTYRSGKIGLSGNLSYNKGEYFSAIQINRFIGSDIYKSKNLDNTDYTFKNARVSADYFANEKLTTGVVARLWARDAEGSAGNITEVFNNTQEKLLNNFGTDNASTSQRKGSFVNYYIKQEIDRKTGHTLSFDIDYNQFQNRSINDLSIYAINKPMIRSRSKQDVNQPVNIWVSKIDYILPIDSFLKIETGLKTSRATVNNDLNFFRSDLRSDLESNIFLYKENINAAYVKSDLSVNKLEFSAGLRMEQTIVTGDSLGRRLLDRSYIQLFPSGSALYNLNKNLAVQASYARRVNRPGFQQQNPFSNFIDSLTYTRGNPQLKPEIVNTSQLNLTFNGQPFLGVAYYTTDDVIIENAPQLEGTKTFTTAQNLARQKRVEIQLNFPIKLGKYIDGFGGNQAIYNSYDAVYLNTNYNASRWHWLAYWQITGTLPKEFKVEFGGFYMTKFLEEFLTIGNIAGLNFGVSKTFANKAGRVALNFNDILYSQKTDANININNVNVNFLQRELSRNIRLSVSYQIGNNKVKGLSRNNASESETSRVKID